MPNLRSVLISVTLATTAFSAASLLANGVETITPTDNATTALATISYQSGLFWPTGHRPM